MLNLFTKKEAPVSPPPELLDGGRLASDEPEAVFQEDRLRVGVFTGTEKCDDCHEPLRWLVIEFLYDGEWKHLLSLEERNYDMLMSVFTQVDEYLKDNTR